VKVWSFWRQLWPLLTKPSHAPHHRRTNEIRDFPRDADAGPYSELGRARLFLSVNGATVETLLPRTTPLLSFLRNDCSLNGPKYGCGLGECGTCSVLIDGRLARACVLTLGDVAGRAVTTLEGLAANGRLDPVQQAFITCAAAQCGYCLNGMIMTARALIDVNPEPTDADIREALRFNLCRCGAHVEIVAAVRLAAAIARA
jgi:nicotinate dehydrogenase subunit A